MNQLGNFEQNLLTELRGVVAERGAERAPEPPRRVAPRRRLVLAAAGAGVIAAAVVLGMPAVDGPSAPAAYAVQAEPDGSVLVSIERFEDSDGLEQAIEAHGISAEVDYTPEGQHCQHPRWEPGNGDFSGLAPEQLYDPNRPQFVLRLRPDVIGDRTVVIEHRQIEMAPPIEGTFLRAYSLVLVEGPVAPCVLVPFS